MGFLLMLVAVLCTNVTLTSGDYRGVMLVALACMVGALACLMILFRRGPIGWRIAAIVIAFPALFVLFDLVRRGEAVLLR